VRQLNCLCHPINRITGNVISIYNKTFCYSILIQVKCIIFGITKGKALHLNALTQTLIYYKSNECLYNLDFNEFVELFNVRDFKFLLYCTLSEVFSSTWVQIWSVGLVLNAYLNWLCNQSLMWFSYRSHKYSSVLYLPTRTYTAFTFFSYVILLWIWTKD
jgi:hypothetical protein